MIFRSKGGVCPYEGKTPEASCSRAEGQCPRPKPWGMLSVPRAPVVKSVAPALERVSSGESRIACWAAVPLGQAYQRENPHPRLLSYPPHRLLPIPEAA
jgi:hypothetical protein